MLNDFKQDSDMMLAFEQLADAYAKMLVNYTSVTQKMHTFLRSPQFVANLEPGSLLYNYIEEQRAKQAYADPATGSDSDPRMLLNLGIRPDFKETADNDVLFYGFEVVLHANDGTILETAYVPYVLEHTNPEGNQDDTTH